MIYELKRALKKSKCKHCKVYDFIDLKFEEDAILQPDCVLVCGATNKNYLDFPPTLVVEILLEATALKDRISKFSIYESSGVKCYLFIDPEKNWKNLFS